MTKGHLGPSFMEVSTTEANESIHFVYSLLSFKCPVFGESTVNKLQSSPVSCHHCQGSRLVVGDGSDSDLDSG